jgi:hypothetical protein
MVLNGHEIIILLSVFFGGGVGVAIAAYLFKVVFGLQSSKVIHTMVVALTVVAAGAQYLLSLKNIPPTVLGVSSTAIYGVSQLVYKGVKAANVFLSEVQAKSAADKALKASAVSVAAVTVPAGNEAATTSGVANF